MLGQFYLIIMDKRNSYRGKRDALAVLKITAGQLSFTAIKGFVTA